MLTLKSDDTGWTGDFLAEFVARLIADVNGLAVEITGGEDWDLFMGEWNALVGDEGLDMICYALGECLCNLI